MAAIQHLSRDHQLIVHMIRAFDGQLLAMERGNHPDLQVLEDILLFLEQFADGIHHKKEETVLFPAMERAGIPNQGGPIGVMLAEHDLARAHLKTMRAHLEGVGKAQEEATQAFLTAALEYVDLMGEHIAKEDNVLYAIATQVINPADLPQMEIAMQTLETQGLEGKSRADYEALLARLEKHTP